ncbi:MAG: patatin-like phospholipase family protein [Rhodobacteraceae bacterium]|nr:MAG: patatin-like phospholipase family protein [Paracoccaceae bacterium]
MPRSTESSFKTALVLQGGGARGAYQVGALKAIAEITRRRRSPFQIVCGSSVGALNAAPFAAWSNDIRHGIRHLENLWRALDCGAIYDTGMLTLLGTGARWAWTLFFGHLGAGAPGAFLDNAPLGRLLDREFDRRHIADAIRSGTLHALCITASSYDEGKAITFFEGAAGLENWDRARRRGVRADIGARHLLASSALPFAFAPVRIGGRFFGDGSLRLTAPLSPAIHTGADRILVIAARDAGRPDLPPPATTSPTFGEMAGHALDILFNDNLDSDHERLSRINQTLALLTEEARLETPLRTIETLMLSPSEDLRLIARQHQHDLPRAIRLLMRSLGSWGSDGRLVSYLLFEPGYVGALIDLGHDDTMARAGEIRAFLER